MEYCSKAKGGCAVLEMLEQCVNSMSLPSPTAGEEISNCLSSHWQHTLTQASLPLIQTELLRHSQQLIGTISVSSFARFSHSGRKEELYKTCNCHSLPKKKKKNQQDIFLFLLQRSYPSNPHPRAFTCLDLKCSLSEGYLWPPLLLSLTCVPYPDRVWIFWAGWLALMWPKMTVLLHHI